VSKLCEQRLTGVIRAVGAGALALCWASSLHAQTATAIADRVDRTSRGRIRFEFTPRENVCGDGMSWYRREANGGMSGSFYGNVTGWNGRDVDPVCTRGPARVVVVRDSGRTLDVRFYVGGTWKADSLAVDVGRVSVREAASYLLTLAERGDTRPARSAMSALSVTDSIDLTAPFLRIARDDRRPSEVRSAALGRLGEMVGERLTRTLDSVAYEPGDRDVRRAAIVSLARRPADESVPALLKMAESLPDRELRRTAVYWLVQSKDPRALAWVTKKVEGN
jgi:hypothetical protein